MWESASAISEPQLLDVNDRRNPRGGASFRFSLEPGGYNPEEGIRRRCPTWISIGTSRAVSEPRPKPDTPSMASGLPYPPEFSRTSGLIVTELVANSVMHSRLQEGDPIALRVQASPDRVHVEVADAAGGFSPVVRHPALIESGGCGLYLVDRLADRWGQIPGDGVWAEVDLPARERAS